MAGDLWKHIGPDGLSPFTGKPVVEALEEVWFSKASKEVLRRSAVSKGIDLCQEAGNRLAATMAEKVPLVAPGRGATRGRGVSQHQGAPLRVYVSAEIRRLLLREVETSGLTMGTIIRLRLEHSINTNADGVNTGKIVSDILKVLAENGRLGCCPHCGASLGSIK